MISSPLQVSVGEVMRPGVVTCLADDGIATLAAIMSTHAIHAVIVWPPAGLFALSAEEARHLLNAAERAVDQSTQLFRFTQMVAQKLSLSERVRIVEMLWEVAYANGVLAPQEDALIRRIAGLVYVPDSDRTAARRRIRQRRGMAD